MWGKRTMDEIDTAIITIMLILSLTLGYKIGITKQKKPTPPTQIPNQKINSTKKYYINGYHINLKEKMENKLAHVYTHNNTIAIQTNRKTSQILSSCNHEILHTKFPEYKHGKNINPEKDSIYFLQDKVVLPTCIELINKIQR